MSLDQFARDMAGLIVHGALTNAIHFVAASAGSLRHASGVMAQFEMAPESELLGKMADDLEAVMNAGTVLLQRMGEDRATKITEDVIASDPPGSHVRLVFVIEGEEFRVQAHKTLAVSDAAELALGLAKKGGRIGDGGVWTAKLGDGTEIDTKRTIESSGLTEESAIYMLPFPVPEVGG